MNSNRQASPNPIENIKTPPMIDLTRDDEGLPKTNDKGKEPTYGRSIYSRDSRNILSWGYYPIPNP
jgi:hypothetical protein